MATLTITDIVLIVSRKIVQIIEKFLQYINENNFI
jgi:hypothetical protein